MTDLELAWLAGILEGEGCFGVSEGRYPRLQLRMTDEDVVRKAARLLGATVGTSLDKRAGRKRIYSINMVGSRAREQMVQLLPWMGHRRSARIREILGDTPKATRRSPGMVEAAGACMGPPPFSPH